MEYNADLYTNTYTCPECHSGVRHMHHTTYYIWAGGHLITVPNFPTWICDVCGRLDYDSKAIGWLNTVFASPRKAIPRRDARRPGSAAGAL